MSDREMFRNSYHFSARRGWINDPNGFSHFGGKYQLFFQHNPFGSDWGLMHWGHAVSENLLTWQELPIALAPGEEYDRDGCYSGTAIEDGGRQVLMYTGHVRLDRSDPHDPGGVREVQCLAYGDGLRYEKSARNPVIGAELLPDGFSRSDFRDPKIWKEDGIWHCLVAGKAGDGRGRLLLFEGSDPERWRCAGTLALNDGMAGGMKECPD